MAESRTLAARILAPVLARRRGLDPAVIAGLPEAERAFVAVLVYGTLRTLPRLLMIERRLLRRPLPSRHADLRALLLLGLYQLLHLDTPDYAATSATVDATGELGKPWARPLINGVLRNAARDAGAIDRALGGSLQYRHAHPLWLCDAVRSAWPQHWRQILDAGNSQPQMFVRASCDSSQAHAMLGDAGIEVLDGSLPQSLRLPRPQPAASLPGYNEGLLHVQDESAQLAAPLLALAPGMRVLDACSAPGGKALHCLHLCPQINLTALDCDGQRLAALRQNLHRCGLQDCAQIMHADAADTGAWWDGSPFERILLDAPCSATGVIRRHPDIKHLRQPQDISASAQRASAMLDALWEVLAPGGLLLYANCSIMPQENSAVVEHFMERTGDCKERPINAAWGLAQRRGRQLLPMQDGGDGFYYALLERSC